MMNISKLSYLILCITITSNIFAHEEPMATSVSKSLQIKCPNEKNLTAELKKLHSGDTYSLSAKTQPLIPEGKSFYAMKQRFQTIKEKQKVEQYAYTGSEKTVKTMTSPVSGPQQDLTFNRTSNPTSKDSLNFSGSECHLTLVGAKFDERKILGGTAYLPVTCSYTTVNCNLQSVIEISTDILLGDLGNEKKSPDDFSNINCSVMNESNLSNTNNDVAIFPSIRHTDGGETYTTTTETETKVTKTSCVQSNEERISPIIRCFPIEKNEGKITKVVIERSTKVDISPK